MGTTTDWRPLFVASAALMLRVKAKKKWPGWSDTDQEAAKTACLQAAADIEGIPDLRARAEAAEQRAEALAAELAQARADARVLAGHWFGSVGGLFVDVEGLTDAEAKVLTTVAYDADELPRETVLAVIRRAIGGAA